MTVVTLGGCGRGGAVETSRGGGIGARVGTVVATGVEGRKSSDWGNIRGWAWGAQQRDELGDRVEAA